MECSCETDGTSWFVLTLVVWRLRNSPDSLEVWKVVQNRTYSIIVILAMEGSTSFTPDLILCSSALRTWRRSKYASLFRWSLQQPLAHWSNIFYEESDTIHLIVPIKSCNYVMLSNCICCPSKKLMNTYFGDFVFVPLSRMLGLKMLG